MPSQIHSNPTIQAAPARKRNRMPSSSNGAGSVAREKSNQKSRKIREAKVSCCYKLNTFWRKLFSKKWRCFYQFSGPMLEVWQQSQLFSFELCTEQTHPRFSNQAWRLSPTVAKMPGVSEEVFSKNAPAVRLQRNHPARNGELSGYRSATTHPVDSGCLNCSSWLI